MFRLPKIKITNVDMHGFCGRDHHPDKSHIGLIGQVVKVEAEYSYQGLMGTTADFDQCPDEVACLFDKCYNAPEDDESYAYCVLYCYMENGEILELMDFEVEVINE